MQYRNSQVEQKVKNHVVKFNVKHSLSILDAKIIIFSFNINFLIRKIQIILDEYEKIIY